MNDGQRRPPPYALDRGSLEKDTRVEAYRASGPGGQHVNKTSSAIRLTHLPSGVVVIAQDSPSQHRNREVAYQRLTTRLKALNYVPKKRVATRPTRSSQVRRVEEKKQRGSTKAQRRRPVGDF